MCVPVRVRYLLKGWRELDSTKWSGLPGLGARSVAVKERERATLNLPCPQLRPCAYLIGLRVSDHPVGGQRVESVVLALKEG